MIRHAAALAGYRIERNPATEHLPTYDHDNLTVHYKYVPFLDDPRFRSAYAAGSATDPSLQIEWRVAVICWAAQHGTKLEGDFVECGVNKGFFSRAICEYVNFNALDKRFYLFDTFKGIPPEQISDAERPKRSDQHATMYPECYEQTRALFAPFPRAILVRGKVPDTLSSVPIEKVAYLSIDMNIAYPERRAIEYFWPKLSSGAFVVLDDYGWRGYEEQRATMDEFARSAGVEILALPTAQGLLIKP
jgi:O-methyltransferase